MTKIISLNFLLITIGVFAYGQQAQMEQSFTKNEPCLYDCKERVKQEVVLINGKILAQISSSKYQPKL